MVVHHQNTKEQEVWALLNQIPDPDIPVISIVELGIVRQVEITANAVLVTLTPSYSGCPAMYVFKQDILTLLNSCGYKNVEIRLSHSPAWTTDWIDTATKAKLKQYGIAPPQHPAAETETVFSNRKVACPFCDGNHTKRTSQFGSTPCKALWFCNDCVQPFEYFKCY